MAVDPGMAPNTAPAPRAPAVPPAILADEVAAARAYVEAARSAATHRGYAADWRVFVAWCADRQLDPLPATPGIVAVFLTAMKDGAADPPRAPKKIATLSRYLAAINDRHRAAGYLTPGEQDGGHVLRRTLAGIRNTHGVRRTQKAAIDGDRLARMLDAITGDDVRSVRDRALLGIGMAAALRRSELVALTVDDVVFVPQGLRLFIARSKTDQAGEGVWIAVPEGRRVAPGALLRDWLRVARITDGPLFRKLAEIRVRCRDADGTRSWQRTGDRVQPAPLSAQGVGIVVKARAAAAGLDPAQFAGHSLRAGFLTEAARQPGASIFKMREVSRHRSLDILAGYVRDHDLFRDHAAAGFL